MSTTTRITAYVAVLAIVFGSAFGIGRATGSPIDRSDDHDAHTRSSDPAGSGNDDLGDVDHRPAASHDALDDREAGDADDE